MSNNVVKSALHGNDAVNAVMNSLGRPLTPKEQRIVMVEGYSPTMYTDTKGIDTIGVGQTGEWLNKTFPEALAHHEDRVRNYIPQYDNFSPLLQQELLQAEYRGDLGYSENTRKLINEGKFEEAAAEFLDHAEFKKEGTQQGIKDRIQAVSNALMNEAGLNIQSAATYKVQKGDNAYKIAKNSGISLEELLSINPEIGDGSVIQPDQELKVGNSWFEKTE